MEEGMSAVASILLDDKMAVDKNALAERLSVPVTSPEPSHPAAEVLIRIIQLGRNIIREKISTLHNIAVS